MSLERLLTNAASCQVYDAGMGGGRPLADRPVLTLQGQDVLAQLRSLLSVREGQAFHCMCLGDATFRFTDAAGQPLATVGLHHAASLRWSGWQWDKQLADGAALVRWLAVQGYSRPLNDLRADEERRGQLAAAEQAWAQAVPGPAQPLIPAMLATSKSGAVPPGLVHELSHVLSWAWPDDVARCRVLLIWYSAGTGRYSGFPVHESIPGLLLAGLPIAVVVQALQQNPSDERAWRGAVRHLAGWQARSGAELRSVPPPLRRQLLRIARAVEKVQAERLQAAWR